MKEYMKRWGKWACIAMCMLILLACFPMPCRAEGENAPTARDKSKTVRVAYTLIAGYQEGGDGEYKTGYGYEYLQKLAKINGWKYEYVYGSFDELLKKLENGEVDLMGQISYSEERSAKFSYGTYEQGRKGFYLYVNNKKSAIDPQDTSTINGKKIGVVKGKIFAKNWNEWCAAHGISCTLVEFEYLEDMEEALNRGQIDALIEGRLHSDEVTEDWRAALKFDSASFYFGVNKNRPDLLAELNAAQDEILEENPFYNEKVQARYMKPVSSVSTILTTKEKTWLTEHGKKIRFGYLEGFPPLCYTADDGTCHGVEADLLASIEKQYGKENIEFEAVKFDDYHTMFAALKKGDISVAWPAYSDCSNAEQSGYAVTESVIDVPMLLVYDGLYTEEKTKKIGVINTGSLPIIYAGIYYPDSEIREYNSYDSAIQAVLDQEVGSVLYVSTTYNVDVLKKDSLQKLNMITLQEPFGISLAVRQEDQALGSILEKGILAFGEAGANHSLITNSVVNKEVTLKAYFEQHPLVGIFLVALFLLVLAGIILFVMHKNMSVRVKTSQTEKELYERLSNSDPLTGLYNRQAVFRKCQTMLAKYPEEPFVMTHIDMAHFRLYNTFFGDEAGDRLLCDVADLFRSLSKDYDHWAYGRIEADVFCAFFPYEQEKYERHLTAILQRLKEYRSDFLIEPKVGMYFVDDPSMPMESMFTRASLAAKEVLPTTPFATVIYDERLEDELNERQQIINDMQTAIDEEQFEVYLQPKYALRTNRPVGAEALVRWMHPVKGMISPGAFIPVFESNGFITTLDRYMWEHVCRLLSKWKNEGKPLTPISVNVSRISMFGFTTVEYLKDLVKKYGIDPKYLELELTESAFMDDPEEMKVQLKALRDAGFTILLDDFGSGYSSLNTLREIPVDVLKLDMEFLSMEQADLRGGLVISSIIRMAKLLNLVVIAEGVETQEQADYLLSVGCEYVQGYLFSRPIPVAEFEANILYSEKPMEHVNEPAIGHIGRILAETGSGTYSMGTVIPTPLACIEYTGSGFAFLRVNPEFFTEFQVSEELGPMSRAFRKRLEPASYEELMQAFARSVKSGQKVKAPILWNTDDGEQRLYICSIAYEGDLGDAAALVVTFINATDSLHHGTKKTDAKEDGAGETSKAVSPEIEGRLWECVKKLVSAHDITSATHSIMQEVMDYHEADRAYIFEFDWEQETSSNTYEICADGVEPMIDSLQDVPLDAMAVWIKVFNEKSLIHIKDLNDLVGDENRRDEYEYLEPQGIQSLIAAPVYFEKKLVGFLGVDNPKRNLDETSFIESLAFLCVSESIREKEMMDLERKSLHDSLTGAFNRAAWEKEQKKLLRKQIPFTVVMIDIDDYKQVNDRFGHQIGDELLQRIVATLKDLFRSDDIIVRYGGDEFVVVLENTGSWLEEVFLKKMEQLNEILSQPTERTPGVTVSAGIAFSDTCNSEDLFRNADSALYHVKNSGKKGCHVYKGKVEDWED